MNDLNVVPAISLVNVSFAYQTKKGCVQVLKDTSYAFETGHMYAIAGPSGSGKSTLLYLLGALLLPDTGEVRYEGKPLGEIPIARYRRDHVTLVYQDFGLLPLLTAIENVMVPLLLKHIPPQQARNNAQKRLSAVGLSGLDVKRLPTMLSGGEQQRVAIARSLATDAMVLLADEPTGNLDAENSAAVVSLLKDIAHQSGKCVILVTHDPSVAREADVVLTMKDGVLQVCPTTSTDANPSGAFK